LKWRWEERHGNQRKGNFKWVKGLESIEVGGWFFIVSKDVALGSSFWLGGLVGGNPLMQHQRNGLEADCCPTLARTKSGGSI
jgi:hypothetical protein